MKKFLQIIIVGMVVAITANVSRAAVALSELIDNNASFTVGDLVFDQFMVSFGGEMPGPSSINVVELEQSGDFGIRFQGGFLDVPADGPSFLTVSYRVTPVDGSTFLGSTLSTNTTAIGVGQVSVTSTFAGLPGNTLTVFDSSTAGTDLLNTTVFDPATSELNVSFTIDAQSTQGAVTVSFVDQTFNQSAGGVIPEISSMAGWSLTLVVACVAFRFHRRRKP